MKLRVISVSSSAAVLLGALASAQVTTRVSVSSAGAQSSGSSSGSPISADGRFVAFSADGGDLVSGDSNSAPDVFVRDLLGWTTERVSVSSAGEQGNNTSTFANISADGRFVVFASWSNNLVAGDTNDAVDVFLHDRWQHTTARVSVAWNGSQGNSDVAWEPPSVDAGGTRVAFCSTASNLIVADTNGWPDVFVRDLASGLTMRVSETASGVAANGGSLGAALSADGRFVAFVSYASNLVAGDTNNVNDVFVRDLTTGAITRVSVSTAGVESDRDTQAVSPSISADGRFVAFATLSRLVAEDINLTFDVFVRDLTQSSTHCASLAVNGFTAEGPSLSPALSSDGRFVSFTSEAPNLVAADGNGLADIFVRDVVGSTTELVSVPSHLSAGAQANGASFESSVSLDGRHVAFVSSASNLVAADSNGLPDVFLRDRTGCTPQSYCTAKVNSAGCTPSIEYDGAPRATPGYRFLVGATQVLPQRTGILIYGVNGPKAAPFQGGTMCVASPTRRTPPRTARPAGVPPCIGVYSFDFNGLITSGSDPALVPGRQVWAQYWMRDDASPSTTGLTNALMFTICD